MKTPAEDLMHEHKAILVALNVIEQMYTRVQNDKAVDTKDIDEIIRFLKVFADKCHHGKEEGFLFPALEEAGIKNQGGPVGAMLKQHELGRTYIKNMKDSIADQKFDHKLFVESATAYVSLLRNHIEKEDKYLFPMIDAKLSASKQQELMHNFDKLEKEVIGEGKHEELHHQLEKFKKKYL